MVLIVFHYYKPQLNQAQKATNNHHLTRLDQSLIIIMR